MHSIWLDSFQCTLFGWIHLPNMLLLSHGVEWSISQNNVIGELQSLYVSWFPAE